MLTKVFTDIQNFKQATTPLNVFNQNMLRSGDDRRCATSNNNDVFTTENGERQPALKNLEEDDINGMSGANILTQPAQYFDDPLIDSDSR